MLIEGPELPHGKTGTEHDGPIARTKENIKSIGRGLVQMAGRNILPSLIQTAANNPERVQRMMSSAAERSSKPKMPGTVRALEVFGISFVAIAVPTLAVGIGHTIASEGAVSDAVADAHRQALATAEACEGIDTIDFSGFGDEGAGQLKVVRWGDEHDIRDGPVTIILNGPRGEQSVTAAKDALSFTVPKPGTTGLKTFIGVDNGDGPGENGPPFGKVVTYEITATGSEHGWTEEFPTGNALAAGKQVPEQVIEELLEPIMESCDRPPRD